MCQTLPGFFVDGGDLFVDVPRLDSSCGSNCNRIQSSRSRCSLVFCPNPSKGLFRGTYNRNAPGAVADFDATQFFARF
jgi:hypothetical protein